MIDVSSDISSSGRRKGKSSRFDWYTTIANPALTLQKHDTSGMVAILVHVVNLLLARVY